MNHRTPRGKIGRLPKGIQEEVNRRLEHGARGAELAAWLNGLSAVRAVLVAQFDGAPVSRSWPQCASHFGGRGSPRTVGSGCEAPFEIPARRFEPHGGSYKVEGVQGENCPGNSPSGAARVGANYLLVCGTEWI